MCQPSGSKALSDIGDTAVVEGESGDKGGRLEFGRDIFRCAGIEGNALQMRRRVQVGAALQITGTTFFNFLHHSDVNAAMHALSTFHFENSAVLLGVNIIVLWKFQEFLRDALLARHVTRIAFADDIPLGIAGESCEGAEAPAYGLIIETGPWTRRVELIQPRAEGAVGDELDKEGSQVPIGKLLQLGLLHVDRKRGEVMDEQAFESLMSSGLVVGTEEITTDIDHGKYAYVSVDSLLPFLNEAGVSGHSQFESGTIMDKLQNNEWMNKHFQLHGGLAMTSFGNLALCMGIGSIVMWLVPWKQLLMMYSAMIA